MKLAPSRKASLPKQLVALRWLGATDLPALCTQVNLSAVGCRICASYLMRVSEPPTDRDEFYRWVARWRPLCGHSQWFREMSDLIAKGRLRDAYLYAMLNYAGAEVRMPPEVYVPVNERARGSHKMPDWQPIVRRYWTDCCVVLGVVFLVAGLTAWVPARPRPSYSDPPPGFSGEARFLIALGAGLLTAGVTGRRRQDKSNG